jgi:hypothetical protein
MLLPLFTDDETSFTVFILGIELKLLRLD